MEAHNTCCTYFDIRGDLDPEEITERLGLQPCKTRNGKDGRGCAHWSFGRCDAYNVETAEQMRATIAPLWAKIPQLNAIRRDFEVCLWLEVVPVICPDESTPCLAPPPDVMAFCLATGTRMDIDLFVND